MREPRDPLLPEQKFECPVCYESMSDSDATTYTSSCGHKTCRACFHQILKATMACPICRQPLLNEKAQISFPDSKLLGLFILNPSFFAVPGSTVLLRVFEPRYLILVRRCIQNDQLFGLQAGFKARRGVLISIRRHRDLPEGHIIMEGLVVGRYEAFDATSNPVEEPETFGLYRMKSRILADHPIASAEDEEQAQILSKRAEDLLKHRFDELSRYDKEVINKICGTCPYSSTYEFSFWLLGALFSPEPKMPILFSPNVIERLQYCIQLMEADQPFECLMAEEEQHQE